MSISMNSQINDSLLQENQSTRRNDVMDVMIDGNYS